jgi:radical SAM superfamily enzyme YgiQ (UPF0313 family)
MSDILLVTINAKWIHPSLALRLLKANLGPLEDRCELLEFALRQPLGEQLAPILAARPRVLGVSVSIWNHRATLELLKELYKAWDADTRAYPVVALGGPEVSHLPDNAEIFRYADYNIHGEGETAFRELCGRVLGGGIPQNGTRHRQNAVTLHAGPVNVNEIKSAGYLYTDSDLAKKLTYVEASRGCPFNCEFCLSAAVAEPVREFPLEPFLAEMDELVRRGARTFKFLDRTFNLNIDRAKRIMEFFLKKIAERESAKMKTPLTVHFEMVPSRFPAELRETLARFPPGSLRLEIGIQTLNSETAACAGRPSDPEKELEILRFLRTKTNAIIHADLIAGLPGEDMASFGSGFDRLWAALSPEPAATAPRTEIQLGILKLLPGAPIARRTQTFGMRYSPAPPYEVIETVAMPAADLDRLKNFARFWELIVGRRLVSFGPEPVFDRFMALSDSLLAHFGRNWGIDKYELTQACFNTLGVLQER